MTTDPAPPCGLARTEQLTCTRETVVAVVDRFGDEAWGCERHAAAALDQIDEARIARVRDWDAARRLLDLPWNYRHGGVLR